MDSKHLCPNNILLFSVFCSLFLVTNGYLWEFQIRFEQINNEGNSYFVDSESHLRGDTDPLRSVVVTASSEVTYSEPTQSYPSGLQLIAGNHIYIREGNSMKASSSEFDLIAYELTNGFSWFLKWIPSHATAGYLIQNGDESFSLHQSEDFQLTLSFLGRECETPIEVYDIDWLAMIVVTIEKDENEDTTIFRVYTNSTIPILTCSHESQQFSPPSNEVQFAILDPGFSDLRGHIVAARFLPRVPTAEEIDEWIECPEECQSCQDLSSCSTCKDGELLSLSQADGYEEGSCIKSTVCPPYWISLPNKDNPTQCEYLGEDLWLEVQVNGLFHEESQLWSPGVDITIDVTFGNGLGDLEWIFSEGSLEKIAVVETNKLTFPKDTLEYGHFYYVVTQFDEKSEIIYLTTMEPLQGSILLFPEVGTSMDTLFRLDVLTEESDEVWVEVSYQSYGTTVPLTDKIEERVLTGFPQGPDENNRLNLLITLSDRFERKVYISRQVIVRASETEPSTWLDYFDRSDVQTNEETKIIVVASNLLVQDQENLQFDECSQRCESHGSCQEGRCLCSKGWFGTDCTEEYDFHQEKKSVVSDLISRAIGGCQDITLCIQAVLQLSSDPSALTGSQLTTLMTKLSEVILNAPDEDLEESQRLLLVSICENASQYSYLTDGTDGSVAIAMMKLLSIGLQLEGTHDFDGMIINAKVFHGYPKIFRRVRFEDSDENSILFPADLTSPDGLDEDKWLQMQSFETDVYKVTEAIGRNLSSIVQLIVFDPESRDALPLVSESGFTHTLKLIDAFEQIWKFEDNRKFISCQSWSSELQAWSDSGCEMVEHLDDLSLVQCTCSELAPVSYRYTAEVGNIIWSTDPEFILWDYAELTELHSSGSAAAAVFWVFSTVYLSGLFVLFATRCGKKRVRGKVEADLTILSNTTRDIFGGETNIENEDDGLDEIHSRSAIKLRSLRIKDREVRLDSEGANVGGTLKSPTFRDNLGEFNAVDSTNHLHVAVKVISPENSARSREETYRISSMDDREGGSDSSSSSSTDTSNGCLRRLTVFFALFKVFNTILNVVYVPYARTNRLVRLSLVYMRFMFLFAFCGILTDPALEGQGKYEDEDVETDFLTASLIGLLSVLVSLAIRLMTNFAFAAKLKKRRILLKRRVKFCKAMYWLLVSSIFLTIMLSSTYVILILSVNYGPNWTQKWLFAFLVACLLDAIAIETLVTFKFYLSSKLPYSRGK